MCTGFNACCRCRLNSLVMAFHAGPELNSEHPVVHTKVVKDLLWNHCSIAAPKLPCAKQWSLQNNLLSELQICNVYLNSSAIQSITILHQIRANIHLTLFTTVRLCLAERMRTKDVAVLPQGILSAMICGPENSRNMGITFSSKLILFLDFSGWFLFFLIKKSCSTDFHSLKEHCVLQPYLVTYSVLNLLLLVSKKEKQ